MLINSVVFILHHRELLEYYRRKVADYDTEYELMVEKLDKYKCAYEQMVSHEIVSNFLGKILVVRQTNIEG